MNKPASPLGILVAGLLLVACLIALWFVYFDGIHPLTTADGALVSPPPAPSEREGAAVTGRETLDASYAPTYRGESSLPRGVNGTNLYIKASVLLKQLSASERKMIKQPREEVTEAEAKALFEKLKPILALIHDAAGADYYDWGLGKFSPDSLDSPMPQYRVIMDLAQAALWSAAYRFAEDPAGAIDDLAARAQIPHSDTNVLIGGMVASSVEQSALEVIRENAAYLNASTLEQARTFLAKSTFNQDASRAFAGEADAADLIFNKITAMSPEERLKWMQSKWAQQLPPAIERVVVDPERLADEISLIKSFNAQMAEAVAWPDAQFNAWKSQFTARFGEYPLAASLLPAPVSALDTFQRVQVQREMLDAGLAILSAGPVAAALARDPFNGNQFSYTTTADGFELRSPRLDKKGNPISMKFPPPLFVH